MSSALKLDLTPVCYTLMHMHDLNDPIATNLKLYHQIGEPLKTIIINWLCPFIIFVLKCRP